MYWGQRGFILVVVCGRNFRLDCKLEMVSYYIFCSIIQKMVWSYFFRLSYIVLGEYFIF